jgi:hypothetical protein
LDLSEILTLIGIGLAGGFVGSLLGLGSSVIIVPLLTLLLHLPVHTAFGTGLVSVIATSSVATVNYIKINLANIRLGMFLETAAVLGSIGGAMAMAQLEALFLSAFFGAVLIYTSYAMVRQTSVDGEDNSNYSVIRLPPRVGSSIIN